MIVSPCISICKTDPLTGFCYGCGRSIEDKKTWKNEETGWQLESFKESYKHKIKNGISLLEKQNKKLKNL